MSALTCDELRDLAPELALDLLAGAERAEALVHIEGCGSCRAIVRDLSDAAEVLPLAAPEAEPPPGFEARVLGALGGGQRRAWRRWAAAVAATAAAAAIVSIVAVRIVDRGRDDAPVVASDVAVSDVWSAPMVSDDGMDVGWAFVSDGRPAAVSLWISYAIPEGEYTVEATRGDGTTLELGTLAVGDGRGTWAGTAPTARGDVVVVSLRDANGEVVCAATGVV